MALWFQCFSVMCGCGAWLTADAFAMLVFLYEWAENAQRRNNEMVDDIEAECRQFCCLAWVFVLLRGGVGRVTALVIAH